MSDLELKNRNKYEQNDKNVKDLEQTTLQETSNMKKAGRKGGQATAAKHDREFYRMIGRKGGKTTAERHDQEFYKNIGRKGGEATAATHGKNFYQDIGHKGGGARALRYLLEENSLKESS